MSSKVTQLKIDLLIPTNQPKMRNPILKVFYEFWWDVLRFSETSDSMSMSILQPILLSTDTAVWISAALDLGGMDTQALAHQHQRKLCGNYTQSINGLI